jgi:hypothetical protein
MASERQQDETTTPDEPGYRASTLNTSTRGDHRGVWVSGEPKWLDPAEARAYADSIHTAADVAEADSPEWVKLAEAKRLNVQPGDVVLVRLNNSSTAYLSAEALEQIRDAKAMFPAYKGGGGSSKVDPRVATAGSLSAKNGPASRGRSE